MHQETPTRSAALSGDAGHPQWVDPGPRCELTELYVAQCDHCRHPSPPAPRRPVSWPATTFAARYASRCGECRREIAIDDPIAWSDEIDDYACGGCAEW